MNFIRRGLTIVLAAAAAGGAVGCAALDEVKHTAGSATNFAACSTFPNQKAAQTAWENAGRPKAVYVNRDGMVCSSLPGGSSQRGSNSGSSTSSGKAVTTDCERPSEVVSITFDAAKYPNIKKHTDEAIAKGWPEVMVINREGAEERREKLLADIPTKPGYDRDEFPAAAGRGRGPGLERGSDPTGWQADVMYVPSSENRSHGSSLGAQLRRYCDGVKFRYAFQ
jgi:hypothetical protein